MRGAKRREARLQRLPFHVQRSRFGFDLGEAWMLHTWRGKYTRARPTAWDLHQNLLTRSLKALRLFVSLPLAYEITIILAALQRNYKQTHCPLRRALFTLPLDYLCGRRYCHHHRYLSLELCAHSSTELARTQNSITTAAGEYRGLRLFILTRAPLNPHALSRSLSSLLGQIISRQWF